MIRCVVLASGSGTKLQSLLDSIFFGEIPDMEIVAVISSDPEANALTRARNAHIEAVGMHREVFPNESTFDLAVRNKIRDLDADLVIDAGFHPGVGPETARAFRNKIIAIQPSLVPAFQDLRGLAVHEAVLARGLSSRAPRPISWTSRAKSAPCSCRKPSRCATTIPPSSSSAAY